MRFHDLRDVPPAFERAVIINVSTDVVASLALAGAVTNTGMRVLLVNASPTVAGANLMNTLSEHWGFDVVEVQVMAHGLLLDRIFKDLAVERILLIDSDAEVRSAATIEQMRQSFGDSRTYGAGWLQPSHLLSTKRSGVGMPMMYRERPWIPCAMFRTAYVRGALNYGISFLEQFQPQYHMHAWTLPAELIANGYPPMGHQDTGAWVHAAMTELGFGFAARHIDALQDSDVKHFDGVTRRSLMGEGAAGTAEAAIQDEVLQRLATAYPALFTVFAGAVADTGATQSQ